MRPTAILLIALAAGCSSSTPTVAPPTPRSVKFFPALSAKEVYEDFVVDGFEMQERSAGPTIYWTCTKKVMSGETPLSSW